MNPLPPIPPEPELPYRLIFQNLEHHATALGYVCMTFANLEFTINWMIEVILPCSPDARRAIPGDSVPARIDFVLKIAALNRPPGEWFAILESILQLVKKDIVPLRNRLIHDVWIHHQESPGQWDLRSSLKASQANELKVIPGPVLTERTLESIWSLVSKISQLKASLTNLTVFYVNWRDSGNVPDDTLPPRGYY